MRRIDLLTLFASFYPKAISFTLLAAIAMTSVIALHASPTQADNRLTLWNRNFDTAPVDQFVQLALDKTTDLYPVTKLVRSRPMEQGEALQALKDGQLDLLSMASSPQFDTQFHTLHFPILKGLLGFRVCLIRKGDQERFSKVRTAFDFKRLNIRVCQGSDWPDTTILQANGIPVTTSPRYQELFTMVEQSMCDCFLRGAQEVTPELDRYSETLQLEKEMLIRYTQPGVVYVNKSQPELATRVELGLLRALDDGSYDALMKKLLQPQLNRLELSSRRSIVLNNPQPSEVLLKFDKIRQLEYQP